MVLNIGIKVLFSLSILILTCFTMKNKRFESKSESFYQAKSDTISDSTIIEMEKWVKEERKYWDSTCQAETKRAKADIKNKKLVYFHYFGMVKQYRSNEEMNELLRKYNIQIDSTANFCTVPSELQNCYAALMDKEIDRKFGSKFIDSLRNVAEIKYVRKNPEKIYDFQECDRIPRYSGDKTYDVFFKSYETDFWKNIKYPDDFEYRKDKDYYSYISAEFTLHKNGTVSNISINLTFQNKKNYKYSSYFINEVKKFIINTKWIPAKTMGITVNSMVPLTLHFK
ncbi:hypothetical protein [Chryseobacterium polytrichastri]|uniref:Uncharacterized protein n=1 Tax=Chryseobacterium polytrichastri TaxID=1302687 RepID=A0A1M7AY46_9FLAO|nr:hypothetical protein [Chryseobacterium polytrichastri]SHL47643.1 hypothetical protein SAMN05444267_101879 [Chryseobacterium polytrichastri]